MRVPLAWNNLTKSIPRLAVSMAGVGFAVVLMFMQTGFRNALFDSTVKPIDELDADLVVLSRGRYSISRSSQFERHQINLARAVEGVQSAEPLYIELMSGILRKGARKSRPIRVFGVSLHRCGLLNNEVRSQLTALATPQTALMDRKTKPVFGLRSEALSESPETAELAGQTVSIVGAFDMGADFANEGTLVMSEQTFASFFPFRGKRQPLNAVDVGLVTLVPGANPSTVKRRLEQSLSPHLNVMTKAEFRRSEIVFWATNTPIGVIFLIGTVMGFVVGVIICYQIIYNDISDHMAELATLKAMGYPPSFFVRLIIEQSVYLSFFGFIPGLIISGLLFVVIAANTGLLMQMTVIRAIVILLLTLLMCVLSGAIALRRLLGADPASLF